MVYQGVTGKCSIEIKKGTGYIIRVLGVTGATFTITEDLCIVVSSSYKVPWDLDTWKIINTEIDHGMQFMLKVKLAGQYPTSSLKTQNRITSKQLKPLTVYRTKSGNLVFWVGKGSIRQCNYGFDYNRQGRNYIYGEFVEEYFDWKWVVSSGVLNIQIGTGDPRSIWWDTRSTLPTNFVEEVWSLPLDNVGGIFAIGLEGELAISWEPIS